MVISKLILIKSRYLLSFGYYANMNFECLQERSVNRKSGKGICRIGVPSLIGLPLQQFWYGYLNDGYQANILPGGNIVSRDKLLLET